MAEGPEEERMKKLQGRTPLNLLASACGILGILLLVQYGIVYMYERDRPIHVSFLSYWGLDPVDRIEFGPARAALARKGKEWILEVGGKEFRPDPGRVNRFLTILQHLRITFRDEATPLSLARYGFKEDDSVRIIFSSKGKVLRVLAGGVGPLGSEEYCVVEGKPHIYKLSDSLSYYALQKLEYWLGKE